MGRKYLHTIQYESKLSDFEIHVQQTMKSRSLSLIKYLKHFLFKRFSSESNIVTLSQNVHKRVKIHLFQCQLFVYLTVKIRSHIYSECIYKLASRVCSNNSTGVHVALPMG